MAPQLPRADGTQAVFDVLAERQRQIEAEGWTPEHDDQHVKGQLAEAAACYAFIASAPASNRASYAKLLAKSFRISVGDNYKMIWPWEAGWFKPKDPRRDLVRAAALILAEIERLDRGPPKEEPVLIPGVFYPITKLAGHTKGSERI